MIMDYSHRYLILGFGNTLDRMTSQEKVKLVCSVYSNVKKLTIAQLLKERARSGEEIATITGYTRPTISNILTEMQACGVVDPTQKSWFTYYSLTKLGKKMLTF
jgi:biotin operon repressor